MTCNCFHLGLMNCVVYQKLLVDCNACCLVMVGLWYSCIITDEYSSAAYQWVPICAVLGKNADTNHKAIQCK